MAKIGSTNETKYMLYANSFGADKTFFNKKEAGTKYHDLSLVINGLTEDIKNKQVKYISKEFRAKALSILLQATDQKKYQKYYGLLKDLPVARTEAEIKELNDARDEYLNTNDESFIKKGKVPRSEILRLQGESPFSSFKERDEYVDKALEIYSQPVDNAKIRLAKTKLKKLGENIDDGKFKTEESSTIYNELQNGTLGELQKGTLGESTTASTSDEEELSFELEKENLINEAIAMGYDKMPEILEQLKKLNNTKLREFIEDEKAKMNASFVSNLALDEEDDKTDDYAGFYDDLEENMINFGYNANEQEDIFEKVKGKPLDLIKSVLEQIVASPSQVLSFDGSLNVVPITTPSTSVVTPLSPTTTPIPPTVTPPATSPPATSPTAASPATTPPDATTTTAAASSATTTTATSPTTTLPDPLKQMPIVGTGNDTEKLPFLKRYHPNSIQLYFNNSSYPLFDKTLEQNVLSMDINEADRIEIMEDIIMEYGKKIFISGRKGSSKEELNELIQLQFCIMRNLQLGSRSATANVKLADLTKLQSLTSGNSGPVQPLQPQGAMASSLPSPQLIVPLGETNVDPNNVQTFDEAQFIKDYAKLQTIKNLNSGLPVQATKKHEKIYPTEDPRSIHNVNKHRGFKFNKF